MKSVFTMNDAKVLRELILNSVKSSANKDGHNYVLLSGGIDSTVILYAFLELGIPYTAVNFSFNDFVSSDTASVKRLEELSGINVNYVKLDNNNIDDIKTSAKMCRELFGRIRKVKVEAIYALYQVNKHLKADWNIYTGYGGDSSCCYHKKDAILISKLGEEHPDVIRMRKRVDTKDEFRLVFGTERYFSPITDANITEFFLNYTSKALNNRFPKSCLVYAFDDYFKKYKNARKPLGFHKASGEVDMFEDLAVKNGYENALKWFNNI